MNKLRRNSIKNVCGIATGITLIRWREPVINSVLLPAHAETSLCMESDILGDWGFTLDGDVLFSVSIMSNGEGTINGIQSTWVLSNNELTISNSDPGHSFTGMLESDCTSISGMSNFATPLPFTGTKTN